MQPPLSRCPRREFLKTAMVAAVSTGVNGPLFAQSAAGRATYFQDRGWLIGCWTRPWASEDYRVGFDEIVAAGMKYVALTGAKTPTGRVIAAATPIEEAAQVGEEARQRGLKITHVYGGGLPLQRGDESLKRMIDNAQAAGAWSVNLTGLGNEETYPLFIKAIAGCCDYAEERNVAIVLKPHGELTATGPHLRKAIEEVGHRNVTVMYDPGNILYYSEGKVDPLEDCRSVNSLVTSISVKDFKPPRDVAVTPGSGEIDFKTLMERMREGGFTHGAAMIEIVSPGDRHHTQAEIRKGRQFLEGLLSS